MDIITQIRERLFSMRDDNYRDFQAALMPTVDREKIIGVRIPMLRSYARELCKTGEYEAFLHDLPHKYYEENNLHAFLIEGIRDFDECLEALEVFLPYVDNWATCDSLRPKVLKKDIKRLRAMADRWIDSGEEYTVRYGIGVYMCYLLDESFDKSVLSRVAEIKSEHYYVRMMIAWFFATALAKQYGSAIKYIENGTLNTEIHNKAIQKSIESHRISKDKKDYLRTLRKK
jgi:3-methyladenine DNA glycosylase AlkD